MHGHDLFVFVFITATATVGDVYLASPGSDLILGAGGIAATYGLVNLSTGSAHSILSPSGGCITAGATGVTLTAGAISPLSPLVVNTPGAVTVDTSASTISGCISVASAGAMYMLVTPPESASLFRKGPGWPDPNSPKGL